MARPAPNCVDVLEIQFKLHDKYEIFNTGPTLRSHVNLLALASSHGLLFAGHPNAAELRVVMHNDLVEAQGAPAKLRMRSVALPGLPVAMACSADGSMLAVNFMLNGAALLQIYSVASFTTPAIKSLYTIRLSAEEGVNARQLLWNPVLNASLAVIMGNGALGMYTLKDGGQFEFHSLDKSQQVKCGCWSPKGKQIVLGFPSGRLQQFKPDLTPAKTIQCPPGVHAAPFDTIALHWLSTFQFAAIFVQQGEDATPALYIVNAPKGGAPSYVNYYDICYSASGPRQHQITFTHIAQWNVLLVVSANAVEVGVLGTNEAGDTPNWVQYSLPDEARIELPLKSNEETFPVGFALDTASTHRLLIDDRQVPVMPMVHVLATHGHLVSFNFLNLAAGAADICSPPPPLSDTSNQFLVLEEPPEVTAMAAPTQPQSPAPAPPATPSDNMSFGFGASVATSTPAMKEKSPSLFAPTQPPATSLFAQQTSAPSFGAPALATSVATSKPSSIFAGFGLGANTNSPPPSSFGAPQPASAPAPVFKEFSALGTTSTPSAAPAPLTFSGFGVAAASKTGEAAAPAVQSQPIPPQSQPTQSQAPAIAASQKPASEEQAKPLYTVPLTFNPPPPAASKQQAPQQQPTQAAAVTALPQLPSDEIDEVVKLMMAVLINSFSAESVKISEQSTGLLASLGNLVELKECTQRLNDLQEIIDQAADRDFELDMQNMSHTLNESYAMLTECRSKLEMFHNPDITRLVTIPTFDPINRRQLRTLQSYLSTNEVQMQQLQQQIDDQWSCYQDVVRRNTRNQMHIPCMEGIYQRMTKHNDMLVRLRIKLDYIKAQLKQKGQLYQPLSDANANGDTTMTLESSGENTIESIADAILSLSMSSIIDTKRTQISKQKMAGLREVLSRQKKITVIQPQRPNRVGLRSEVILEQKQQNESRVRAGAATNVTRMQQEKVKTSGGAVAVAVAVVTTVAENINPMPPVTTLAKPTATKATLPAMQLFAPPTQAASVTPNFNFGATSPFVKPTAAAPAPKALDDSVAKAPASSSPSFFAAPPTFTGFGMGGAAAASGGGGGGGFASTQPQLTFTAQTSRAAPAESLKEALAAPPLLQTPISFAAKVIGGDTAKPQATVPTSAAANAAGFATLAATAQPKAAVAPIANKENKKPDEKPKVSFSFGGSSAANAAEAPGANVASGGFFAKPASAKPGSFAGLGASLGVAATSAASGGTTTFSATSPPFSFALGKTETTAAEAASKPPSFAGFGKPIGDVATAAAPPMATASTGFSFGALNLSTSPTAPTSATAAPTTTAAPTAATAVSSAASSDPTDSFFASLSVCKPTAKEEERSAPKATTASNVFAGFGAGSSGVFSFASAGGDPAFGTKTSFFDGTASSFGKPTLVTAGTAAATVTADTPIPATPSSPAEPVTVTPTKPSTPIIIPLNPLGGSSPTPAVSGASPLFGSAAATPMTATPPSSFSAVSTAAAITISTATPTAFGAAPATAAVGAATATSSATAASHFGTKLITPTAGASPSMFGGGGASPTAVTTGGSIFSGIANPDQSVFGNPTSVAAQPAVGLFAAAAAANPSPFGGMGAATTAAASVGSHFGGGGAVGFGKPAAVVGGSMFGGAANTSPFSAVANTGPFGAAAGAGNSTSSMFGDAAKPAEGANMFGSAPQSGAVAASGGSLFGQSLFGQQAQSGGNLFGGSSPAQPAAATGAFGAGVSIFGGGATSPTSAASGGSLFGGGGHTSALAPSAFGGGSSSGFGSFASPTAAPVSAFGPPAGGAVGAFAQSGGAGSVAQTGFGSPQIGASAFAKPLFGATPSFGSPPAFGAQPSFGGAATFGSPKGFGFGSPTAATPGAAAFSSPPTQKNNLFEALGSTDQGPSFGNLAQTTSNAQKPSFGGSSFMNYRA